jgi:cyclase
MRQAVARAPTSVAEPIPAHPESGVPSAAIALQLQRLTPRVHLVRCLHGIGGNVVVLAGQDGLLLVDSMLAAHGPRLQSTLRTASSSPVRLVINTHSHQDHSGGNKTFRENATVIAQANTFERLREKEGAELYPMQVFADEHSLWFGGEVIHIRHMPASHTDGDAIVYFERSGVLHLGDIFFRGMFPVHPGAGGTLRGLTRALEFIVEAYPRDTIVVPGHGEVTTVQAVSARLSALKVLIDAIERSRRDGRTSLEFENDPKMQALACGMVSNDAHAADYLDGLWMLID